MTPGVRRDLLIGGAVIAVGIALLAFACFGGDDGFKAPRWVVAIVALAFMLGGAVPLRMAISDHDLRPHGTFPNLAAALILAIFAVIGLWIMVGVGPEGVALDAPIPLPETVERWVKAIFFYGLLGTVFALCVTGAFYTFKSALPALGRTAIVAVIAPLVGLGMWVAIEYQRTRSPPMAPVLTLTFDKKFPGDGYLVRANGDELFKRPGRFGDGLWVGGSGDWLDVDLPTGFDTGHGLTVSFWMKRESWVNPYMKGAATQTIATVDLERLYKGRPELRQVSFSLMLSLPRELAKDRRALTAESYRFRPVAYVGDVRLAPAGTVTITPQQWTHIAIVYDRFIFDRMRLYLDGKLIARSVPMGSAPGYADIRSMRIGTRLERNGAYRGMVDEVKVYARPLSDSEIESDATRTS
jgi:hypothetical protein